MSNSVHSIQAKHSYHHNEIENESDSNSSLASSSKYNERHPRVLDVRNKSSGRIFCGGNVTAARGSLVMLGSRTSLPPVDENSALDVTESQLTLNLRRATRSSSWTNQKILDTIDGIHTSVHELDPCLGVVARLSSTSAVDAICNNDSWRKSGFEKFVPAKSISNLSMKSRSSGSVNPPAFGQNKEGSSNNILSGIREDDDEEQQDDNCNCGATTGKHYPSSAGSGNRFKRIAAASVPAAAAVAADEMNRKLIATGGENSFGERKHDENHVISNTTSD